LIGTIAYWARCIIGIEIIGVIAIIIIGIEIKCGMIGHGALHLIVGHHLVMICGVIITMDGIHGIVLIMVGMALTLIIIMEDGRIMAITFMESQAGEEVTIT